MYTMIETERGDEYTEKEVEKERGDEIKSLGRTVNREGTEWGLGREKNPPPSSVFLHATTL